MPVYYSRSSDVHPINIKQGSYELQFLCIEMLQSNEVGVK